MGEVTDFFEQLRMTTETKLCKRLGVVALETYDARTGINATIEALMEMMVGEPLEARATWNSWYNITYFWRVLQPGNTLGLEHGDCEGVYAIIFRRGGKSA